MSKMPKKRKHARPGLKLMAPTWVGVLILGLAVAGITYLLFNPRW